MYFSPAHLTHDISAGGNDEVQIGARYNRYECMRTQVPFNQIRVLRSLLDADIFRYLTVVTLRKNTVRGYQFNPLPESLLDAKTTV